MRQTEKGAQREKSTKAWEEHWATVQEESWRAYKEAAKGVHGVKYDAKAKAEQFFDNVKESRPALRKSIRFFTTCSYAVYLSESVRACSDTIEFLEKFLRDQG